MAFLHGRKTFVYIDQYNMSAYFNTASIKTPIETAETTSFADSQKKYIGGLADGTFSLGGMFDGAAAATDIVLRGIIQPTVDSVITVVRSSLTVGSTVSTGGGILTSYDVSSPVGDVVSVSAEFQGSGGARSGMLLREGASLSASGNGTAVDNAVLTSNGGLAVLHVISNAQIGTTDFIVEHSTDNVTYATLASFTQIPASTLTKERIYFTGTVNRYVRCRVAVSSTGAVVPIISVVRF